MKVLHSICQQIWKTQQWPQDWKRSVFIPIAKMAMPKNVQTTVQLHSFHMLARLSSKSFKLVFKACESRASRCTSWIQKRQRNQRSNCQHPLDHRKRKIIPEKISTSASLTMLKPLTVFSSVQSLSHIQLFVTPWRAARQSSLSIWLCGSQASSGKFFKRWEYQTT